MIVTSVCRLCMSEKELRWVFDEGIAGESDMKTIIFITTGVEISQNDIISQKICSNCFKLTGKMFEFRERAVKTDKYLKDHCKNPNQNRKVTDTEHPSVIPIQSKNTTEIVFSIGNENEVLNKSPATTDEINPLLVTPEKSKPAETVSTPEFSKKKAKKRVHKSIEEIFARHTEIKLPSSCLRLDVSPSVTLELDFVEEYFRQNKQDMKKYIQHALRSNRASKKTLQVKQTKSIKVNNTSIEDNNKRIDEENTPGVIKHPDQFKVSPISVRLTNIPPSQKGTDSDDNDDNYGIVKSFKPNKRRRISDSSTEAESAKQSTSMENSVEQPTLMENSVEQPTSMEQSTSMENSLKQPTLMENSVKQPTLMETLQLKPKENAFVHRCTVCNSLQRSAKALKEHYQMHFKCIYCKKRFKLMNRKEAHDKKCAIMLCLTRPVYVKLEKVDVTKYLKNITEDIKTVPKTDAIAIQVSSKDEIIELSDDDTDPNPSTPPVAACTSKSIDLPATSQVPLNNDLPKLIHIGAPLNITTPIIEQLQCTGTSIVKPSIHIKDNCVLNSIDTSLPDNKVLKQLLCQSTISNLKLLTENETQTNIPSNDEVRYSNDVAEFKNLFPHLYSYKIPINVKKGEFKVSYDTNQKSIPNNKKSLAYWSHTKPVDIKCSNNPIFNIGNFNKHISLGIPLFSRPKKSSQPTILNHTLISQNLPQLVQTNVAPRTNTSQPVQNSNFQVIPQPAQNQYRPQNQTKNYLVYTLPQAPTQLSNVQTSNVLQQVQTQTSNIQAHSLPQQVQTHTGNIQTHSLPQQVQTHTGNIQAHSLPQQVQTQTGNIQARSLPQRVQTQTSNIQTHNLPQQVQTTSNISKNLTRQIQSNLQSLTAPLDMPTINVQSHVLPQTLPYQIQNVPQQASSNTIPINSSMFTLNPNLQNIQQTPVYNGDLQNFNNYFLNSNNNTVIVPVTNSTPSLNSTITSNIQGSVNTNENTFSRSHIQSNQQSINLSSNIMNIPASLSNTAPSTSSHLSVRNNPTSTITNFSVNTSYPSSASTNPPPNVNPFSKTAAGTISGINTFASTSTESQRNVENNTDVHKPMIRVRNIFELT